MPDAFLLIRLHFYRHTGHAASCFMFVFTRMWVIQHRQFMGIVTRRSPATRPLAYRSRRFMLFSLSFRDFAVLRWLEQHMER